MVVFLFLVLVDGILNVFMVRGKRVNNLMHICCPVAVAIRDYLCGVLNIPCLVSFLVIFVPSVSPQSVRRSFGERFPCRFVCIGQGR